MGRPRKYPLETEQTSPEVSQESEPTVTDPVPRVRILSDRIEYLNPAIETVEYVRVGKELTNKICPSRATVSQGVLIIDELGLTIGMTGVRIRVA